MTNFFFPELDVSLQLLNKPIGARLTNLISSPSAYLFLGLSEGNLSKFKSR